MLSCSKSEPKSNRLFISSFCQLPFNLYCINNALNKTHINLQWLNWQKPLRNLSKMLMYNSITLQSEKSRLFFSFLAIKKNLKSHFTLKQNNLLSGVSYFQLPVSFVYAESRVTQIWLIVQPTTRSKDIFFGSKVFNNELLIDKFEVLKFWFWIILPALTHYNHKQARFLSRMPRIKLSAGFKSRTWYFEYMLSDYCCFRDF